MFTPSQNIYAQAAKPGGIDAAIMYFLRDLHMRLPLAMLLTSRFPAELERRTQALDYVERTAIDGTPVHHLAGRTETVDYQVWITEGARPRALDSWRHDLQESPGRAPVSGAVCRLELLARNPGRPVRIHPTRRGTEDCLPRSVAQNRASGDDNPGANRRTEMKPRLSVIVTAMTTTIVLLIGAVDDAVARGGGGGGDYSSGGGGGGSFSRGGAAASGGFSSGASTIRAEGLPVRFFRFGATDAAKPPAATAAGSTDTLATATTSPAGTLATAAEPANAAATNAAKPATSRAVLPRGL